MLTFGSLFTGIGGIDLGLERAGMECRWQVEIDPFCNQILEKHWPGVKRYGDIRQLRGDELEPVDFLAGGYPCQPFSQAGKRGGDSDPRHLWPEFARLIRILRPRGVLLENVPGHLSLGFGAVLGDLARLGYDAEWLCLRASDFGAAHLRKRVFVVAYRQQFTDAAEHAGTGNGREDIGRRGKPLAYAYTGRNGQDGEVCTGRNAAEHAAGTLADSTERGFRIMRESPEFGRRLAYGSDPALENARRAGIGRLAQSAGLNGSGSPVHDCGAGGTLGNAERAREDARSAPEQSRRTQTELSGAIDVSDTPEPGLEEWGRERSDRDEERETTERNSGGVPDFAPGPSDSRWPAILRERPDLAPSLPNAIRKHANNAGHGAGADSGELSESTEVLGFSEAAIEPPLRGVADGVSDWLDRAMSERTKRLRALGNAVVPQVAEYVGRALQTASTRPTEATRDAKT